jgi:glycine cleavage system H protein
MTVYRGCDLPADLWYDVEHDVWIRPMPDGTIVLGMTDLAQTRSGKILHLHFKKAGRHVDAGQSVATIETAKWVGAFTTPVPGTIVEANDAGFGADILIANRDPYGAGWLVCLRPDAWPPLDGDLVSGDIAVQRYVARIDAMGISCFRCAD